MLDLAWELFSIWLGFIVIAVPMAAFLMAVAALVLFIKFIATR